jgi:hypothetical protein
VVLRSRSMPSLGVSFAAAAPAGGWDVAVVGLGAPLPGCTVAAPELRFDGEPGGVSAARLGVAPAAGAAALTAAPPAETAAAGAADAGGIFEVWAAADSSESRTAMPDALPLAAVSDRSDDSGVFALIGAPGVEVACAAGAAAGAIAGAAPPAGAI